MEFAILTEVIIQHLKRKLSGVPTLQAFRLQFSCILIFPTLTLGLHVALHQP
jgi:hypothetical protein